jgi:multicomponent Na+:H+ antiporter subunit E
MMVYWIVLSGKFDAFHIILGVFSCAIIALWSSSLLFNKKITVGNYLALTLKISIYLFWLLGEIVKSNIHVLKVVFSPKMNSIIEPQMITFKSKLKSDEAKYLLANSITLTPGTVTVKIDKDEFLVHALTPLAAAGVPGDMEDKIAKIFGESK